MNKTTTKTNTKTQIKCLKHPACAIFLKGWWLTHSQYDNRYLTLFTPVTLVTLVTMATLVTLFRSYYQFYRVECITVSGLLVQEWHFWPKIAPKFYFVITKHAYMVRWGSPEKTIRLRRIDLFASQNLWINQMLMQYLVSFGILGTNQTKNGKPITQSHDKVHHNLKQGIFDKK